MTLRKPIWVLDYESTGVTSALAAMVTSVMYADHLHGESDEVELTVEDTEEFWRTGWFPSKGDRLVLSIGYEGEQLLPCGGFQVDEVELGGPPRGCTIRALSAGVSQAMRTKKSRSFVGKTLKEIVETIATELELELVGEPEATKAPQKHAQQKDETSLEFLKKLADETGHAFNVRDTQLVFWQLTDLEDQEPIAVIAPDELLPYRFTSSAQATYVACEERYFDPDTGELFFARVTVENMRDRGGELSAEDVQVPTETIRQGDTGDLVREWQTWLQPKGLYDYKIDGIFGPITHRGTKQFQRDAGIAVDGIVGPETWRAAIAAGFRAGLDGAEVIGDVLHIHERCESNAQAEVLAGAALHRANRLRAKGSIAVRGNPRVVSGVTVEVEGLQRLSGKYVVEKAVHRLTSDKYTVETELTHVPD